LFGFSWFYLHGFRLEVVSAPPESLPPTGRLFRLIDWRRATPL
jgi:hypothetical protein